MTNAQKRLSAFVCLPCLHAHGVRACHRTWLLWADCGVARGSKWGCGVAVCAEPEGGMHMNMRGNTPTPRCMTLQVRAQVRICAGGRSSSSSHLRALLCSGATTL